MVLKKLCALRGVSGDEGRVRDYIRMHAERFCDTVKTDRMGNLLAFKKSKTPNAKHVLLAAHMDEVGLMILGIEDSGLLRYAPVGGIDPRVMLSKRVLIGENEVPGVVGVKAIHLQSAEERKKRLDHDDLYIDVGAKDKAEAEKLVSPGDYVTFMSEWTAFGDGFVKAKALDDRVGCMNLMSLMEGDYPADVTFAFTVQEEVGLRGAKCAAFNAPADLALVLESTAANDLGNVPEHMQVCVPGKGVAVSFMDRTSIANAAMLKRLHAVAEENGISWQVKRFISGGNDAGAIHTSRGPVPTAVLSVPCRYIHSPSNVAKFSDIEAQFLLAEAFLLSIDKLPEEIV